MKYLLEVCVDSVESAQNAAAGGADRLELCANLILGGTSPTTALIQEVQKAVDLPINVLLRPRFGDFCYTKAERRVLLREIEDCRRLGVNGVVIGTLTPEGCLDLDFLKQCIQAAGPLKTTLHRAFDLTRDPLKALEQAISLGMNTILTSGQKASAPEGAVLLGQLCQAAAGRISILAGSGVGPDNAPLLAQRGVRQFHCSGKRTEPGPMQYRREGVPMGLALASEYERSYTSTETIAQMRAVLDQLAKEPQKA